MNESSGIHLEDSKDQSRDQEEAPATGTPGNSETQVLQKQIQDLEAQAKEKESKYIYLYAEFENYKKRSIKERSELIKFGWESVARELLQTADNLERVIAHVPAGTDQNFMNGLVMVMGQFRASLQKQGVEVVETTEKPFDPNFHEAIGQEPSSLPSGVITQEHTKGYTLHGRLLRPARVVLSSGIQEIKD